MCICGVFFLRPFQLCSQNRRLHWKTWRRELSLDGDHRRVSHHLALSCPLDLSSVVCPEMASNSPTKSAHPCFHGRSLRAGREFFSSRVPAPVAAHSEGPRRNVRRKRSRRRARPLLKAVMRQPPRALGRAGEAGEDQTQSLCWPLRDAGWGPGVREESGSGVRRTEMAAAGTGPVWIALPLRSILHAHTDLNWFPR